jgi:hypothetical protein
MMPNKTYELRKLYFEQNKYRVKSPYETINDDPMISLPDEWNFKPLQNDVNMLEKNVKDHIQKSYESVAEQVFGSELKKQYTHLKHAANLLIERSQLHKRHLKEIDKRHIEAQEKLFGVQINHAPDKVRRLSNLEGQLAQLEKERRDEELAFWKDTVDLRQQLFESGWNYRDALQRTQVFSEVEVGDV